MTVDEAAPLEIDSTDLSTLTLETAELPYVDLEEAPGIHRIVLLAGTEYIYDQSFPIKGHSAIMPGAVAELQAAGKKLLVVERDERYIIYAA